MKFSYYAVSGVSMLMLAYLVFLFLRVGGPEEAANARLMALGAAVLVASALYFFSYKVAFDLRQGPLGIFLAMATPMAFGIVHSAASLVLSRQ